MLLSELKAGDLCTVHQLIGDCSLKQKMMTMGIVPGVEILIQKYAPLGYPLEIKIKHFNLSLRKREAATIVVQALS